MMSSSPTTVDDLKTWKGAKSVCFPTATETIKKLKLKNLGQVSGDHAVKWSLVWDFWYSGSPVIFLILYSQSPTRSLRQTRLRHNPVPRVLSLLRESNLVTAGHVSARF